MFSSLVLESWTCCKHREERQGALAVGWGAGTSGPHAAAHVACYCKASKARCATVGGASERVLPACRAGAGHHPGEACLHALAEACKDKLLEFTSQNIRCGAAGSANPSTRVL